MRDLTSQELQRLAETRIDATDLAIHWDLHPEMAFETALTELVELRHKLGLDPTGPAPVEEAPVYNTTDGLPPVSIPLTELDPSDPNYVKADINGWPVVDEKMEAKKEETVTHPPSEEGATTE